jgi:tetratricopeptide (TPR) repeat protein
MLGEAYAFSGDFLSALKVVEELKELSKTQYIAASLIAPIYMALGDHNTAFQLLEEALEQREYQIHTLTFFFVSIYRMQDDPRYLSLMERSWIPQE